MNNLCYTGSEISTEPSYILLNTAVSSQWGFPLTCPDNCPCKKYDCHSKQYAEKCGFSDGFCDMMTKPDVPPQYKVNYVRVYQNPNLPEQKVGCSTPERPTRRYIEANEKLYKSEYDVSFSAVVVFNFSGTEYLVTCLIKIVDSFILETPAKASRYRRRTVRSQSYRRITQFLWRLKARIL